MTELMQMVIDKLGVKVGERFNLSDTPEVVFCFIGSGQLAVVLGGVTCVETKPEVFIDLLNGKSKIIKLPFKPTYKESYRYISCDGSDYTTNWSGTLVDYYRFNANNCFRIGEKITEEDKKRILAEMKSKYESE